ncbi:MAG: ABC transporter permease [Thermonemataceae bacterium]
MLRNYLKIAYRNLLKSKAFTAINLLGLSAAFVISFMLLLVLQEQLSYDQFHTKKERLFRLYEKVSYPEGSFYGITYGTAMPTPIKEALKKEVDGIEQVVRVGGGTTFIDYKGKKLESGITYTESEFYEMFSFEVLKGSRQALLRDNDAVVMNEKMAQNIFGEEDPIGKKVLLKFAEEWQPFRVAAIMKDGPENSTIQNRLAINFIHHPSYAMNKEEWGNKYFDLYLQITPKADVERLSTQLRAFAQKQNAEEIEDLKKQGAQPDPVDGIFAYKLQPITDIHFDTVLKQSNQKAFLYLMGAVSIFILVVAGINFVNLSLANLLGRAKEVGVRKIMGAYKKQLLTQFFSEAFIVVVLAYVVCVMTILVGIPSFNAKFDTHLSIQQLFTPALLLASLFFLVVMALLAGAYPAAMIFKKNTSEVIKGKMLTTKKKSWGLSNTLLAVQFMLSAVLIGGTFTVWQQMQFMRDKTLGYNQEEVISIPVGREVEGWKALEKLKALTASNPNVKSVGGAGNNLGRGLDGSRYKSQLGFTYKDRTVVTNWLTISHDYLQTIGAELIDGRFFSEKYSTDTANHYVINESMAKLLNEEEVVGLTFKTDSDGPTVKVVGVVKDFHFESLRDPIEPLTMSIDNTWPPEYLFVRINTEKTVETMQFLEKTWREIAPASVFQGSFQNENVQRQYVKEKRLADIFIIASAIILIISCMGLFAMTLLMVNRRTKEIGIRKVLGASVTQITYLLNSSFLRINLLALLVAFPLIYLGMNQWLDNFSYRTSIGVPTFLITTLLLMLITLLTVSFHTYRAARRNPVKALKYE